MISPAPYYARQTSLRSRVVAALLSAGLLVLLLLALLSLGWTRAFQKQDGGASLTSMNFDREQGTKAKAMKVEHAARAAASNPQPSPVVTPPQQPVTQLIPPSGFIRMSHADFAASDISRIPHATNGSEDAGAGSKSQGPGEGPGGVRLYNAQWYREPTNAEMGSYMRGKNTEPGSWATIACKTVEHFHVEDCQELDEYPLGSGLARGLRQAAWQFLIWPPRINGTPQVGAWVRIRYSFVEKKKED